MSHGVQSRSRTEISIALGAFWLNLIRPEIPLLYSHVQIITAIVSVAANTDIT